MKYVTLFLGLCLPLGSSEFLANASEFPDAGQTSVETYVGSGFYGLVDGPNEENMFNQPAFLGIDTNGIAAVWDKGNLAIREISATREVTTIGFAARGGRFVYGLGRDATGTTFFAEDDTLYWISPGEQRFLSMPLNLVNRTNGAIAVAPNGAVFVADTAGHLIKVISPEKKLSVHVGSGNKGNRDGHGIFCSFSRPFGLAVTPQGELFIAERDNPNLRFVTADGVVTTLPDTSAIVREVLAADRAGNVYCQYGAAVLKREPNGNVVTLAGEPNSAGYENGSGADARFRVVAGLAVRDDGNILVADSADHRIRRVFGNVSTGPAPTLAAATYPGITVTGIPGRRYRIEASKESVGPWTVVAEFTLPTPTHMWFDTKPEVWRRYYRALMVE